MALASNGRTALLGAALDKGSLGGAWAFVSGATISEQAAREVTQKEAALHASVNPNGEEVTSCVFEYGTTTAYGSTAECSPAKPGSGEAPSPCPPRSTKLAVNTTYHFRVAATQRIRYDYGTDTTFTTLATFASAETEPAKPAKATDGQLSVEGSGGTGKVTIGPRARTSGASRCPGPGAPTSRSTAAPRELHPDRLQGLRTRRREGDLVGQPGPVGNRSRNPSAVYSESPTPASRSRPPKKPGRASHSSPTPVTSEGPPADRNTANASPSSTADSAKRRVTADEKNGKPKGTFEWFAARPTASRSSTAATRKTPARRWMSRRKNRRESTNSAATHSPRPPARPNSKVAPRGRWNAKQAPPKDSYRASRPGREATTYTGCKQASTKCASAGVPAGTIQTRTGRNGGLLRRRQVLHGPRRLSHHEVHLRLDPVQTSG